MSRRSSKEEPHMKKLFATLALAATVVTSLAATAPARAAEDPAPQLLPQLAQPNLSSLQLKPIAPIAASLFIVPKAELTSQLFVYPTLSPYYRDVWCLVRNTGLKNSGWFQTRIRMNRRG